MDMLEHSANGIQRFFVVFCFIALYHKGVRIVRLFACRFRK